MNELPEKITDRVPNPIKKKMKRILTFLVVFLILIALVIIGVSKVLLNDGKTTKLGFENIGELATQSVLATQVEVSSAAREFFGRQIPFTESKSVFSYDVEIKAGIDFSDIKWDVTETCVNVTLPEAKVLSTEIDLDSFKVYHEKESIFRKVSLEDTNSALVDLEEKAANSALENGLLEKATENAKVLITNFFAQEYDLEINFTES